MRSESDEEAERLRAEFEMSVFANDQTLYYEMFEKERQEAQKGIDWMLPRGEGDVKQIMEKLKELP